MRFRDWAKESKNHIGDPFLLLIYTLGTGYLKEEEVEQFQKDWLNGRAVLSDWVRAGKIDLIKLEKDADLTKEQKCLIFKQRLRLYDLFIEYILQNRVMEKFMAAIKFTPYYAVEYAKQEICKVNDFLSGKLRGVVLEKFIKEYKLGNVDYNAGLEVLPTQDFGDPHDVNDTTGYVIVQIMKRYLQYLKQCIADNGVLERYENEHTSNEFSFKAIFSQVTELTDNILIEYSHQQTEHHNLYEIISVSGCNSPLLFKDYVRDKVVGGYPNFIDKIQNVPLNKRDGIYRHLINEAEELKNIVIDIEHVEEVIENVPIKKIYKIFKAPKFRGTIDELVAFNKRDRNFILLEAGSYAIAWLEMVDEVIRRIEQASFTLDFTHAKQKVAASNNQSKLSFTFKNPSRHPYAVRNLWSRLKKADLIEKSTEFSSFKKVFTGEDVTTPIIWTGSLEALVYFIKLLVDIKKGKVIKDPKISHWDKTCHCFIRQDGKRIDRKTLTNQHRPASALEIESIVDTFDVK